PVQRERVRNLIRAKVPMWEALRRESVRRGIYAFEENCKTRLRSHQFQHSQPSECEIDSEESGNTVEKDLKFKNQNWRLDTLEKQVKLLFARLNHNLLIVKAQRDEIKNSEEVASEIHKLMEFFAEKNNNLLDRIATLEKRFDENPRGFAATSVASKSALRGEMD